MEDLIVCHPNVDWEDYLDGEFKELENIPTYDLMQALVLGYEVEKTPHEVIATEYITSEQDWANNKYFNRNGFAEGIEFTLNTLGITVKGVNDNETI